MPFAIAVWSPENIELLKSLWKQGHSASQIAPRIPGATRSAVIGKVHRLGLSSRKPALTTVQKRAKRAKPSPPITPTEKPEPEPSLASSGLSGIEKKIRNIQIGREIDARPPEPPPQPRGDKPGLMQLGPKDCKWPFGDPRHSDFHFCGAPMAGVGPYCAAHTAEAYGGVGVVKPFIEAEDNLIRALWDRGRGLPRLAAKLGRSMSAVGRHAIIDLKLSRLAA